MKNLPGYAVVSALILLAVRAFSQEPALEAERVLKHGDVAHSAAFFPDGRRAATGSWDGRARVWNLETGEEALSIDAGSPVNSVAVSPDGKRLAVAARGGLSVWDAATGTLVGRPEGHAGNVTFVAYARDGKLFVSGGADHTARLWDSATLKPKGTLNGNEDFVLAAAFSADGARVYTVGSDKTVRAFLVAGAKPAGVWRGHAEASRWVAVSPDGARVATTGYDGTAREWDAKTGAALRTWKPGGKVVTAVEYLPDGRVVTSSRETAPTLWTAAGGPAQAALKGHDGIVEGLAVSKDGRAAMTAGWDKTVRVWRLPPPPTGRK